MDRTVATRRILVGLAVACCLWMTLPATARGVVLTGTVVEPSREPGVPGGFMPLEGVTVTLEGNGKTDTTGPNGMFQFPNAPQGDLVLRLERKGYVTDRRIVSVRGGIAPSGLVLQMKPESVAPLPAFARSSVYVAFADHEWFDKPHQRPGTAPSASLHFLGELLWGGGELPPGSPPPTEVTPISAARNPILVFDPRSPQKISYLEASQPAFWLAFNASGSRLFVASAYNTIHVFETDQGVATRRVVCPAPVIDLVRGKDMIYAALMGAKQVQVLDGLGTRRGLLDVPGTGRLQSLAADPAGRRIFAGLEVGRGGRIAAYDTTTSQWVAQENTGACPLGMTTTPDGRFLLATEGRTAVAVRDATTLKTVAVIPVGITPVRIAVAPDGTLAWVSCRTSDAVYVLDLVTLKQAGVIDVDKEPMGLAVTADGARLYVACRGSSTVCAVDTKTRAVMGRTSPQPRSRPTGVAIRP